MADVDTPEKIIGYQDSTQPIGYLPLKPQSPLPTENNLAEQEKKTQLNQDEKIDKKEASDKKKLAKLSHKPSRILFRLKSTFPLQLFPDEITIEDDKVNVVIRRFFYTEEIRSSGIKDIAHIEVETSLFFSTIILGSKSFSDNMIRVSGFWTGQAKRARRIIEGLRVIQQAGIDTASLSNEEILKKAEELGTAQGVEHPQGE